MKNLICTVSVVLFLILTLSAHQTLAATIHVPAGYNTIQGAIDVAVDGDLVLVAPDTYVENIDFLGKAITVRSEEGAGETVIDGNQSGTAVVSFVNGELADSVLDGFTIRNGNASGLYLLVCSPTITNCVITENSATEGGGICCRMPQGPRATITNCVIAGNSATKGGGIYCYRANPTLEYCTIFENTATDKGGGIYWDHTNASPKNCIVWENTALIGPQLASSWDGFGSGYDLTVSYCDVQGGEADVYLYQTDLWWLEGNIDAAPLFAGSGDYHLTALSPCIDAGADAGVYIDIDGDLRPQGEGFDMGADEFVTPALEYFIVDDGDAELFTGASPSGLYVMVNRFVPGRPVMIGSISFYTAPISVGQTADLIIMEDPTGTAELPDSSMEVWRRTFTIKGPPHTTFREEPVGGVVVNEAGDPDAAFFIGVANTATESYRIGVDKDPPIHDASFRSMDGGATYMPLSELTISYGNAMIRGHEGDCPCWDQDGDEFFDASCGWDDCDDTDPAIYPGAPEICDNGHDDDCVGGDEGTDNDLDGYIDTRCGGDDCNDDDPDTHPGIDEEGLGQCDDEIDQDCSGCDCTFRAYRLSDTGMDLCYGRSGTEIPCPDPGEQYYGQDANYPIHPMSFTDNGDGTVMDNVTDLMWQREDDDIGKSWDKAIQYCEDLTLGGFEDWRLPNVLELLSIVDFGSMDPAIETDYFPGTGSTYWTSDAFVHIPHDGERAWRISFDDGDVGYKVKTWSEYMARCVRGQPIEPCFTDNGDGTVTDNHTWLMWQQEYDDATEDWQDAMEYCEALYLAGQSDWRLPNIKELMSIADHSRYDPAIDETYFKGTFSPPYSAVWSSTSSLQNPEKGWIVDFGQGSTVTVDKDYPGRGIRCVRISCWDEDGDGYEDEACGGYDCDDSDPEVNPGMEEILGNGIDDDCDGEIDEKCFVGVLM